MAKLWTTETGNRMIDDCLQFFGGYGYMSEYPISRLYADPGCVGSMAAPLRL